MLPTIIYPSSDKNRGLIYLSDIEREYGKVVPEKYCGPHSKIVSFDSEKTIEDYFLELDGTDYNFVVVDDRCTD